MSKISKPPNRGLLEEQKYQLDALAAWTKSTGVCLVSTEFQSGKNLLEWCKATSSQFEQSFPHTWNSLAQSAVGLKTTLSITWQAIMTITTMMMMTKSVQIQSFVCSFILYLSTYPFLPPYLHASFLLSHPFLYPTFHRSIHPPINACIIHPIIQTMNPSTYTKKHGGKMRMADTQTDKQIDQQVDQTNDSTRGTSETINCRWQKLASSIISFGPKVNLTLKFFHSTFLIGLVSLSSWLCLSQLNYSNCPGKHYWRWWVGSRCACSKSSSSQ